MEFLLTFDAGGDPGELVERTEVHKLGLWHKAAQVLLCDSQKRMLIQQRSGTKDLYPDCWDYAVGEHLQPNETYLAGAARGLTEELGVVDCPLTEIGTVRRREIITANHCDREFQQSFCGCYDGPIVLDREEVQAWQRIDLSSLDAWLERAPGQFTPLFRQQWSRLRADSLAKNFIK